LQLLFPYFQWKVRRTLAFSIHELAVILGEDITHRDLVPVFDGFLKDLDEVRIGILRHLADFLRVIIFDINLKLDFYSR
jgi:serine/threonine-protein phosphatase 4 regulatory subunit 1